MIDLDSYEDNKPHLSLPLDADDEASREVWDAVRHRRFALWVAAGCRRKTADEPVRKLIEALLALLPPTEGFWPYHRFALALLLALVPTYKRKTTYENAIARARPLAKLDLPAPLERGALVPRERDPLRLLLDLQIRRFLTTNYDHEIEKLLKAEGYAHAQEDDDEEPSLDPPSPRPDDPLAAASEDLVFDADHTGHMFAFVAHTPKREGTVVHLHGRAGRNEQLIVTEEDYQQRYLAEGPKRSLTEDSLRAAFASHPLLFIGSGLGEDDLVRPLRQFVHDPTVGAGRLAIALLPALDDDPALERKAISNLQRYGVYTLHFGAATEVPARPNQAARERIDWLKQVIEDLRGLRNSLETLSPTKVQVREPSHLETMSVSLHPGLSVARELALVEAIQEFLCHRSLPLDPGLANAIRTVIQGIEDSITGAFLCARLLRVVNNWGKWRDEWLELPAPENIDRAFRDPTVKTDPIFRRHNVRLPSAWDITSARMMIAAVADYSKDLPRPRDFNRLLRQRFDARAYSPTFSNFLDALTNHSLQVDGRRIFLLVTRRGVGKGHFAAGLGEPDYHNEIKEALGASALPTALFNLSFSHEVSSTFDQLGEFLLLRLGEMEGNLQRRSNQVGAAACKTLRHRATSLRDDRIGRLEVILQGLHDLARDGHWPAQHRLLVVFNRFSVLFDSSGDAKNAQVERIVRLLVAPTAAKAPIDLMLLCNDATLPRHFRPPSAGARRPYDPLPLTFLPMRPPHTGETRRRDLERREAAVNIDSRERHNFVHFLQPARASLLAVSYFPSVALAIAKHAADGLKRRTKVTPQALPRLFDPTRAFTLRMEIRKALDKIPAARPFARESLPVILAAALQVDPELDPKVDPKVDPKTVWTNLLKVAGNVPSAATGTDPSAIRREYLELVATIVPLADKKDLDEVAHEIDTYFKLLFEACGGGRFALTLLLACAYHLLLPAAEWQASNGDRAPEPDAMQRTFDAAIGFLERMRRTLTGLPRPRRDDMILERALEAYRRIHETPGYPLPAGLNHIRWGVKLFDLMQQILWHLAVIGQPVVTEILAEAPAIAQAADAAKKGSGNRLDVVLDALVLLEARCLVFEIHSSHLTTNKLGLNGQTRWAVHRLVQRHVFLTMNAPFVDYSDTDQFALTLYASQPNDVPRLALTAYRRLMSLLSGLTAYPESPVGTIEDSVWDRPEPQPEHRRLRSQLIRAALGVLRSSLSLTTLLRLNLEDAGKARLASSFGPLRRGVLDEHRLLLRWMLHQAKKIEKEKKLEEEKKNEDKFQLPLYAEEIVWLHNEVATVALLQGRVIDAVAHYARADDAARIHLEPSDNAALRVRIALNRAYADINRGRMSLAAAAARRIIAIPDEHKAIGPIAHGVLALVQHIRGRYDDAAHHYGVALDGDGAKPGLLALDRSRAAALSAKSYGDMLRAQSRWEESRLRLTQGYTLALEGSHEDVRHLVALSQIRLDMADTSEHRPAPLPGIEQHRRLDDAETYAGAMGIPQLQCEVAQLRATLHIEDGDLKTAASVAGAGLSIATANDLQLRTTSFLLLLSDIYVKRELYREARPLLRAALRMARTTEYHSAHQNASILAARLPPLT